MECINCPQCIDACDSVMAKVGCERVIRERFLDEIARQTRETVSRPHDRLSDSSCWPLIIYF